MGADAAADDPTSLDAALEAAWDAAFEAALDATLEAALEAAALDTPDDFPRNLNPKTATTATMATHTMPRITMNSPPLELDNPTNLSMVVWRLSSGAWHVMHEAEKFSVKCRSGEAHTLVCVPAQGIRGGHARDGERDRDHREAHGTHGEPPRVASSTGGSIAEADVLEAR